MTKKNPSFIVIFYWIALSLTKEGHFPSHLNKVGTHNTCIV